MRSWLVFAIVLFASLFCSTGFTSTVQKISKNGKTILVSRDSGWNANDEVCVVRDEAQVACGKIVKVNAKAALVKLDSASDQIVVGDTVQPSGGATNKIETTKKSSSPGPDNVSSRGRNKIGFYVAIAGDPFPSLIGLNLAYNVFPFLRVFGGWGSYSVGDSADTTSGSLSITSLGGGARVFWPTWDFSPFLGLAFANVSVTTSVPFTALTAYGFAQSGSHVYGTAGFDWASKFGFEVAFGYNMSFLSGVGGAPFLQAGWFFDFF